MNKDNNMSVIPLSDRTKKKIQEYADKENMTVNELIKYWAIKYQYNL